MRVAKRPPVDVGQLKVKRDNAMKKFGSRYRADKWKFDSNAYAYYESLNDIGLGNGLPEFDGYDDIDELLENSSYFYQKKFDKS